MIATSYCKRLKVLTVTITMWRDALNNFAIIYLHLPAVTVVEALTDIADMTALRVLVDMSALTALTDMADLRQERMDF